MPVPAQPCSDATRCSCFPLPQRYPEGQRTVQKKPCGFREWLWLQPCLVAVQERGMLSYQTSWTKQDSTQTGVDAILP